jgi:outer membrane protein
MSLLGLRPLLVCSAILIASPFAFAQTKVGVVNLQSAVLGSAEIKKANDAMPAKFKAQNDKIQALQAEVENLSKQLEASQGKLSASAEAEITAQGQRKQRDLERLTNDLNEEVTAYRNDILGKSTEKMQAVIKQLAEAKGLDLVVEAGTTYYFKSAIDLTAEAIAAYDKANPAK